MEYKISLNELQLKAINNITKFINSKHKNYLLLGPAGSGKTTIIINVFNSLKDKKIAFCAFTNKATQILKETYNKFNINLNADFLTIHTLLKLEPSYNNIDLEFQFSTTKIKDLSYDIIVFDECSTISKELYNYIKTLYTKNIKFIFLGDFWQLPPPKEKSSIIFKTCKNEKWPVSKLTKVMRATNESVYNINMSLLNIIEKIKVSNYLDSFHIEYPNNILDIKEHNNIYISKLDELIKFYLDEWENNDTTILTYSRNNCIKINQLIQKERHPNGIENKFYKGDKCCIDKPIYISTVKEKYIDDDRYYTIDKISTGKIYNGEIFKIINSVDIKLHTPYNDIIYKSNQNKNISLYFDAQLISIEKDGELIYLVHINENQVNQMKMILKQNLSKVMYINVMTDFYSIYPVLNYGYCLTIYKFQGSESHTIIVNLNSIKWSIKDNKQLFKATYTAITRAKSNIKLYWINN